MSTAEVVSESGDIEITIETIPGPDDFPFLKYLEVLVSDSPLPAARLIAANAISKGAGREHALALATARASRIYDLDTTQKRELFRSVGGELVDETSREQLLQEWQPLIELVER